MIEDASTYFASFIGPSGNKLYSSQGCVFTSLRPSMISYRDKRRQWGTHTNKQKVVRVIFTFNITPVYIVSQLGYYIILQWCIIKFYTYFVLSNVNHTSNPFFFPTTTFPCWSQKRYIGCAEFSRVNFRRTERWKITAVRFLSLSLTRASIKRQRRTFSATNHTLQDP